MTVSKCKGGVGEDALGSDGDVDIVEFDILGLVGTGVANLERVDGHVELFIGLRRVGLVEQPRSLVLDILVLLLLLLGGDLALGLFELLAVDLGLDLADVGGLEIDAAAGDGQGRRHVALRADLDGLIEAANGQRPVALASVGRGVLFYPFLDKGLDLALESTPVVYADDESVCL